MRFKSFLMIQLPRWQGRESIIELLKDLMRLRDRVIKCFVKQCAEKQS